jgi:hypothetical protein
MWAVTDGKGSHREGGSGNKGRSGGREQAPVKKGGPGSGDEPGDVGGGPDGDARSTVPTGASGMHDMKTIEPKHAGQKPIKFHEGGLHESTGTPSGKPISAAKHSKAASGSLGPKAEKQENFYRNVLKH